MEHVKYVLQDDFIEHEFDEEHLAFQESQYEDVVYGNATQALLLKNGQYLIPGHGLVFQDEDNLSPFIISDECNQSQDSFEKDDNVIHYIQEDEFGQQIIYKVTDDKSFESTQNEDLEDLEIPNKRIKLEEDLCSEFQEDETINLNIDSSNEVESFVPADENVNLSGKNQYAILKDGKLYLHTYDGDELQILTDENGDNAAENCPEVEDEFQKKLAAFEQSITADEHAFDVSQITGKNLLTGETLALSLDENQRFYIENDKNFKKKKPTGDERYPCPLVYTNKNGRKFIGKILEIKKSERAKKLASGIKEYKSRKPAILKSTPRKRKVAEKPPEVIPEVPTIKATAAITKAPEQELKEPTNDGAANEIAVESLFIDTTGNIIKVMTVKRNLDDHERLSKENVDYISKTLVGLMELTSMQKKLLHKTLHIKIVEKQYNKVVESNGKLIGLVDGRIDFKKIGNADQYSFSVIDEGGLDEEDNDISNNATTEATQGYVKSRRMLQESITINKIVNPAGIVSTRVTVLQNPRANIRKPKESKHDEAPISYIDACEIINEEALQRLHVPSSLQASGKSTIKETNSKEEDLATHTVTLQDPSLPDLVDEKLGSKNGESPPPADANPHQCDLCPRAFSTLLDLNAHRSSHSWKTYTCEVCEREFQRHSNLVRHAEIHKGQGKKYSCHICDCTYNYSSSLTRHIVQNHIQIEPKINVV